MPLDTLALPHLNSFEGALERRASVRGKQREWQEKRLGMSTEEKGFGVGGGRRNEKLLSYSPSSSSLFLVVSPIVP